MYSYVAVFNGFFIFRVGPDLKVMAAMDGR